MTPLSTKAKIPTVEQISAGGVAFRRGLFDIEIAIVRVAPSNRWQLPKGLVDAGESPEMTAVREVREEAGIETKQLALIDTIEYWYVGDSDGQRVRFHKFVHFFLLLYQSGDVHNHDREVSEACWVNVEEALTRLSFKSERSVVEKARLMIADQVD